MEGGEGKVTRQYVFSLKEMAKQSIRKNEFGMAVKLLVLARKYPENWEKENFTGHRKMNCYTGWEPLTKE